jgi:hypothetical protein
MKLAWAMTFKKFAQAEQTFTWTFYADNLTDARDYAERALIREYYGKAVLLKIERAN